MSLNADIASALANCYVERVEANAYFLDRVNAAVWATTDELTRDKALITAAQRLDQEEFVGTKQTVGQSMKWPRLGAINFLNDEFIPESSIPQQLKEANYELALHLLTDTSTLDESGLKAFEELPKPGGLNLKMRNPAPASGELPQQVVRALRGIVLTSTGLLLRS